MKPKTWEHVEMMLSEAPIDDPAQAVRWLESQPLARPRDEYGSPRGTGRPMFELFGDHDSGRGTYFAYDIARWGVKPGECVCTLCRDTLDAGGSILDLDLKEKA